MHCSFLGQASEHHKQCFFDERYSAPPNKRAGVKRSDRRRVWHLMERVRVNVATPIAKMGTNKSVRSATLVRKNGASKNHEQLKSDAEPAISRCHSKGCSEKVTRTVKCHIESSTEEELREDSPILQCSVGETRG